MSGRPVPKADMQGRIAPISFNQTGLLIEPGALRHIVNPVTLPVITDKKGRVRIVEVALCQDSGWLGVGIAIVQTADG